MAINDLLSPDLKVPELKPGEVKIFRRLLKGKIDPMTEEPYNLTDYWQSGKAMIFDNFTKKRVLLLNQVGVAPVELPDGKTLMKPVVGMIKWDQSGELIHTEDTFEEYCFLMRSNQNESNKFRNKRQKATFFLVDSQKQNKELLADYDLEMEAALYCRDVDIVELKTIAKKLNINASNETLRTEILRRIKSGGAKQIMIASPNTDVKLRIQIKDAEEFDIIIFNDVSRDWFFSDNLVTPICNVPIDKDRVNGLIEFFGDQKGLGKYAKLAKKVKALYEAL